MPDETPDWAPATDTATATVDSDIPDWAPKSQDDSPPDWAPKDSGTDTPATDSALKNAVQATKEFVSGMIPKTPMQYAASTNPMIAAFQQGQALARGDVSGIPFVGRVPEIIQAEKTPAGSKERFLTAEKTLMDVGMLAGAKLGGETDASRIASTESVPSDTQGKGVDETPPLRQQGETAGAQEPEPVSTDQPVATEVPQEQHGTRGRAVREPIQIGSSVFAPESESPDASWVEFKYEGAGTVSRGGKTYSLSPEQMENFRQKSLEPPLKEGIQESPPYIMETPKPVSEGGEAAAGGGVGTVEHRVQHGEHAEEGYTAVDTPEEDVGISQAKTEAELGIGSVEPGSAAEMGSGLRFGRNYINKGGDPRLPIRRALASGMVGKNDVGIVHAELDNLRSKRNAAAQALEANPNDPVLQQNLDKADKAQRAWRKELQPVLTKASDTLREVHASSLPEADPTTYQGLADIMDEHFKGEREITPEMRTAMTKAAKGAREVRDSANAEMKNVEQTLTKQLKGKKVMTPRELDADLRSELEDQFSDCVVGG